MGMVVMIKVNESILKTSLSYGWMSVVLVSCCYTLLCDNYVLGSTRRLSK